MTLRDLIKCVATDNHATYKVTKFGYNHTLDDVHWEEIGRRYKDSEVWMAYPIKSDHCAVKQWHIILK